MINVFYICNKMFVSSVFVTKCSKIITVLDICYNVFVCPVDVIMHEDDQCLLYCYKVFVCPVYVTKCTKMINVFYICYKVYVCSVFVKKCTKIITVFDICCKVILCPVYVIKCRKMINVFDIYYSVCMSCVCYNARRWSMSFIFVTKCFYVLSM